MKYSPTYNSALEIQRVVAKEASDPSTPLKLRPSLARAFVELEMLKLRLRMKPAPKPVDVSKGIKRTTKGHNIPSATEEP